MIDCELHAEAEADLDAAAIYYEDQIPGLGVALIDEVEQAIGEIGVYPPRASALARRVAGVWHSAQAPPPLSIRSAVHLLERRMVLLAVPHLSREPGFWLRRVRP